MLGFMMSYNDGGLYGDSGAHRIAFLAAMFVDLEGLRGAAERGNGKGKDTMDQCGLICQPLVRGR